MSYWLSNYMSGINIINLSPIKHKSARVRNRPVNKASKLFLFCVSRRCHTALQANVSKPLKFGTIIRGKHQRINCVLSPFPPPSSAVSRFCLIIWELLIRLLWCLMHNSFRTHKRAFVLKHKYKLTLAIKKIPTR